MITNKKGLSDIVTTALIILLVAVAVAAIWAFIAPALRGTGTQFTKTQVCVSNIIEPLTCKTKVDPSSANAAGVFPATVQVRLTLTDGVAIPTEFETAVGTSPTFQKQTTNDKGTKYSSLADPTAWVGEKIPRTQGTLISLTFNADADADDGPTPAVLIGASPQAQVTTTYRLPDNTIVKCPSLPITCNTA